VCLLALCVADGYKTHKNKTMMCCWWLQNSQKQNHDNPREGLEWRDELWLPNVWILTLCLFTPTSTSHFFLVFLLFFGVSGCHHQANPFTERTWLSHSSSKSDLGFVLLCITSDHWLTQGQNINRFKIYFNKLFNT
jgi:hypothetical protein